MNLEKIVGWTLLVSLGVGSLLAGVSWVVWLWMSWKHQKKTLEHQELTLGFSKEAADRTLALQCRLEKLEDMNRKIDKVTDHIHETTHPPSAFDLPRPPLPPAVGLHWLIAPAMVLATVAFTGAGIRETGGVDVPKQSTGDGAELARHGFRLMSRDTRDYKGAETLFRQSLDTGGDRVLCLEGIVQCQMKLGRVTEAEATVNELAQVPGGVVRFHTLRGWMLATQGRTEECRPHLRVAAQNGDEHAADLLARVGG